MLKFERVTALLGACLMAIFLTAPGAWAEQAGGQDFCANPQKSCARMVSPSCLQRLGAGSVEAGEDQAGSCAEQFKAYRSCLQTVANLCPRTSSPAPTPSPVPAPVSKPAPSGGGDAARVEYCRDSMQTCLSDVSDDYSSCAYGESSDCQSQCRDQRNLAREDCRESHKSCLTTGFFEPVVFIEPACLGEATPTSDYPPAAPYPPATPQAQYSYICRNGLYWCQMFQAGPVGTPCWCNANPMTGVPYFEGFISSN
ncbi:MAG: hypothetical protein MRY63_11725 [Neomegalonema sp.]|nr:hypothetical protein [Neomegalonema sp.]